MTKKHYPKEARCKICKSPFMKKNIQNVICGYVCSLEYAKKLQDKRDRKKKSEARKVLKEFKQNDKTSLKVQAQSVFNKYIRLRDKGNKCISCECNVTKGDASHFYSVGAFSQLRFNTNNVHLSCYKCNRFLHGNLSEYRPRLIKKIGIDRFNKLELDSKSLKKYDSKYYNRIIKIFNKKIKKLML